MNRNYRINAKPGTEACPFLGAYNAPSFKESFQVVVRQLQDMASDGVSSIAHIDQMTHVKCLRSAYYRRLFYAAESAEAATRPDLSAQWGKHLYSLVPSVTKWGQVV